MRKFLPLLLAAGAGVILLMLSRGQAAKNLKVYFKDLYLKGKRGISLPDIFLRFNVVNGSNTGMEIRSIVGDLLINNNVISSVQQLEKISIAANSSTVVTVKLDTPPFNVAMQIVDFIVNKRKNVTVGFDGNINAQGVLIPINQTIKLF